MANHQAVSASQADASSERFFDGTEQAIQQEGNKYRKQRQCRAQFLALQIAPDEIEEFHSGLAAESWPLSKYTVRVARAEACGSCVTMMMVLPCSRLSACNRLRISSPDLRSKSPVGSSHSRMVGSVTMARAMPTRCCSPPESVRGKCFAR